MFPDNCCYLFPDVVSSPKKKRRNQIIFKPFKKSYKDLITLITKFNNLELALGIALRMYTSVVEGLNLKVGKLWELIYPFVEITGENLVWRVFVVPHHPE